jgi:hypothetical protein
MYSLCGQVLKLLNRVGKLYYQSWCVCVCMSNTHLRGNESIHNFFLSTIMIKIFNFSCSLFLFKLKFRNIHTHVETTSILR